MLIIVDHSVISEGAGSRINLKGHLHEPGLAANPGQPFSSQVLGVLPGEITQQNLIERYAAKLGIISVDLWTPDLKWVCIPVGGGREGAAFTNIADGGGGVAAQDLKPCISDQKIQFSKPHFRSNLKNR